MLLTRAYQECRTRPRSRFFPISACVFFGAGVVVSIRYWVPFSSVPLCLLWPVHGVAVRADRTGCLSADVAYVCSWCALSTSLRNFSPSAGLKGWPCSGLAFLGPSSPVGRGDRLGAVGGHLCRGLSLPEGLWLSQASWVLFFLATGFLLKPGSLVCPKVGPGLLCPRLRVPLFSRLCGLSPDSRGLPSSSLLWGPWAALSFPRLLSPNLYVSGCCLLFCLGSSTGSSPPSLK